MTSLSGAMKSQMWSEKQLGAAKVHTKTEFSIQRAYFAWYKNKNLLLLYTTQTFSIIIIYN